MFDLVASPTSDALSHVRLFLAARGAEVIRAAGTLGGPGAEARALRLLEIVRDGAPPLGQIRRELDWLWRLLTVGPIRAQAASAAGPQPALAAVPQPSVRARTEADHSGTGRRR